MPSAEAIATQRSANGRGEAALLALVLGGALAHRIYLAASTDFPIGDGGLFHAFVVGIAASFPALPAQIGYNGLTIPFAYPPLSFWIGAGLVRLGASPMSVVHLMPIALSALVVLLFAWLLRRSGRSALFTAVALFFFCTMLRSFEWEVMGGGLSRSLGAVFLMMSLICVGIPSEGERSLLPLGRSVAAGAAVAGAILSHLEWGLDAAACVVLSRALGSASLREFIRSTFPAGLVGLLLVLPWIVFVVVQHGLAPLASAGGASAWGAEGILGNVFWLAAMAVTNPLIPVGLFLAVRRKDLFWPGFLLIVLVLTPRHGPTPATTALAVFAATALEWLSDAFAREGRGRRLARAAGFALALLIAGVQLGPRYLAASPKLRPLDAGERAAMAWIAREHPGARFAVLTDLPWWYDRSAEWFPIVAGAQSVNTLQGREWRGHEYGRWYAGDVRLKHSRSCPELFEALAAFPEPDFYWVQAHSECFTADRFRPLFANRAVTIFAPLPR